MNGARISWRQCIDPQTQCATKPWKYGKNSESERGGCTASRGSGRGCWMTMETLRETRVSTRWQNAKLGSLGMVRCACIARGGISSGCFLSVPIIPIASPHLWRLNFLPVRHATYSPTNRNPTNEVYRRESYTVTERCIKLSTIHGFEFLTKMGMYSSQCEVFKRFSWHWKGGSLPAVMIVWGHENRANRANQNFLILRCSKGSLELR